jgi:hypothetical protein
MHPIGAVNRTSLYNMDLLLLSVTAAAIVVAFSIFRHHPSFGSLTRSDIVGEDVARTTERTEKSRSAASTKQFLVVVLPDGKIVNSRVAEQL